MVAVYTARISYSGPDALDITAKSGKGIGLIFAPPWDMVMGVKRGRISEAEYTERYLELLRRRYRQNEAVFMSLLRRKRVVLCCYCGVGFCHRHIAVDVLEKIARAKGMNFQRGGELQK